MRHAGFIPALTVLIIGSSAAYKQFRVAKVLLLAMVLIGLSVAIFIWGLGLPYRLVGGE